jgi:hypothetical protein
MSATYTTGSLAALPSGINQAGETYTLGVACAAGPCVSVGAAG